MCELLEGLYSIHINDDCHGAITPDNIFVNQISYKLGFFSCKKKAMLNNLISKDSFIDLVPCQSFNWEPPDFLEKIKASEDLLPEEEITYI